MPPSLFIALRVSSGCLSTLLQHCGLCLPAGLSRAAASLSSKQTSLTPVTASVSPRGQMLLTWSSSFKNSPLLSSSISSSACVTPVLPQWRKPLSPLALRRSAACPFKAWGIPAVTAGCCPYLGSYEASRRGESLAPVSTNKARTGVT